MNSKIQNAVDGINSGKVRWHRLLDEVPSKYSKAELAIIYRECVKLIPGFYGELRELAYEKNDNWYKECYHHPDIKKGYYPYIPFHPKRFYELLKKIITSKKIESFLDVGAGYGDKVLLAKDLLVRVDGIEYLEEYIHVAKSFGIDLIHKDAFEFEGYENYDLIYMYHPIYNEDLYTKLVKHLIEKLKPGGYLLEVYDPYGEFEEIVKENKERLNLTNSSIPRTSGILIKKLKGMKK